MRLLVVVLLTVAALYAAHLCTAAFVYEDARWLDATDHAWTWRDLWQPRGLTLASWTVTRTAPAAHLLNLSLHLLVVLLTALCVSRVSGDRTIGIAVAAIVALHPLTVETVAYASSRSELLSACGVLGVLLCVTATRAWLWGLIPIGLIGIYASKESGLCVIALVPLVLWWQGQRVWALRLGSLLLVSLACAAVALWPHVQALGHLGEGPSLAVTPAHWVSIQAAAITRLLLLSAIPVGLSVDPTVVPVSPYIAACLGVLLAAAIETLWRWGSRLATMGATWTAIAVAPRLLVRTPWSPFNEHQWYLPLIGMACVIVALITQPPRLEWA